MRPMLQKNGTFVIYVYISKAHSCKAIHWHSFPPQSCSLGLLCCLLWHVELELGS